LINQGKCGDKTKYPRRQEEKTEKDMNTGKIIEWRRGNANKSINQVNFTFKPIKYMML
jgi:hypothetical protein